MPKWEWLETPVESVNYTIEVSVKKGGSESLGSSCVSSRVFFTLTSSLISRAFSLKEKKGVQNAGEVKCSVKRSFWQNDLACISVLVSLS